MWSSASAFATIPSGQSLSNAIDLTQFSSPSSFSQTSLFGFFMPDAWTAASLTLVVKKPSTGVYVPMGSLYDGTEITNVVTAGMYFPFPSPIILASCADIKLQSGTSASPVNQTADRIFELVLRSI